LQAFVQINPITHLVAAVRSLIFRHDHDAALQQEVICGGRAA